MWKDDTVQSNSHYLFQSMLWVAIVCALILFMPSTMVSQLKLSSWLNESSHFIGIFFLISATYLAIDFLSHFVKSFRNKQRQSQLSDVIQDRIKNLAGGERAVLREFYLQRQTSLWLPKYEADVKSLLTSGILMAVDFNAMSRKNDLGEQEMELMISHLARPYLTKTRLKLPQGKPSNDDITYLKLARPSYILPITQYKRTA
ncbi:MAG: super-infection exclusion protein B [Psychrobium sp.]|nr:super-infection exclusion protein B [Psychrobium sp.]